VLTPAERANMVAFRQKTLPPLDNMLGCLQTAFPTSAAALCTLPQASRHLHATGQEDDREAHAIQNLRDDEEIAAEEGRIPRHLQRIRRERFITLRNSDAVFAA